MRCTFYLPGLCQYSVVPGRKGVVWRFLFLVSIAFGCIVIIAITIAQNFSIARLQAELDSMKRDDSSLMEVESHKSDEHRVTLVKPTDFDDVSLNYGVLVDCGSSGSRVFVYYWPPHNGEPRHLLNIHQMRDASAKPVVFKVEPGLDAFADKPSEASDHIRPLLKFAASNVPKSKHKETPVYIMATAGLRMLNIRDQDAILDDLRVDLPLEFDFLFSPTYVEVISGKQEGIYSWIAVNYVLGKFDHNISGDGKLIAVEVNGLEKLHFRKRTVGVTDLGGASLQVAFELPKTVSLPSHQDDSVKSLLAEFSLGCSSTDIDHVYRLYVATFLGFGTNSARSRYEEYLLANHVAAQTSNTSTHTDANPPIVFDSCLPVDRVEQIRLHNITFHLHGTGNLSACRDSIRPLLNKTAGCDPRSKCSIAGVFQPEIDFQNSEFVGFSEFFYTMEDILLIGGQYDQRRIWQAAKDYCSTNWSTIEEWKRKGRFPRADANRYRLQCFKSAWMFAVLHDGLGFPEDYGQLTSMQYVDGQQVHWTLGALLYKTKYFPLREIEKRLNAPHHAKLSRDLHTSYYLLSFCTVVVIVAICLYMCRLRVVTATPSRLRRVQTMSYYMIDESEAEEGIRFDRSHSYADFSL